MAYPVDRSAAISLDEQRVRRWVADFRKPERLDDPVMRALLRAYGRDPTGGPLDVGRRATQLMIETVESLEPPAAASIDERLPYRVMKVCFLEGMKSSQAAPRLGLSERQLSRERSRAISLLTAALATPLARARPLSAPPASEGIVSRPAVWKRFGELVADPGRAHVYGPIGSGKTSLVAEYVRANGDATFWYRVVPGINTNLWGLLLDLGENLGPDDPRLADYLDAALPSPDLATATRLAVTALRRSSRVIVVDEFDGLAADPLIRSFLDEVAERSPQSRVITVGRRRLSTMDRELLVPPLTLDEATAIAAARGVECNRESVRTIHRWTGGSARLFDGSIRCLGSGAAADTRRALRASSAQPVHTLRGLVSWTTTDLADRRGKPAAGPRRTSRGHRPPAGV